MLDGEIWEEYEFVGFDDVAWNFTILQIDLQSFEILLNQNVRYFAKNQILGDYVFIENITYSPILQIC